MTLPSGIIQTPEGHYVLEIDSHLSRWVEEHKRLDVASGEIQSFKEYIKPGSHVLDAGACIGDHTSTYAELVGPSGIVWAFEPHPTTYQALRLNFVGRDNVRTINAGLSDFLGESKMHNELNVGACYVTDSGTIPISLMTIDSLNLDRLDFIHLDCEGGEIAALKGASNTIKKFRPVMVIEICHGQLARLHLAEKDVLSFLDSIGYTWRELAPQNGPHNPNRDIICLPK